MNAADVTLAAGVGALAVLGVGLVIVAVRLSGVHAELDKVSKALNAANAERDKLREALVTAGRENASLSRKLDFATDDQARRLRFLREQLDQCGDDSTRGRVAIAGLRRILQSLEAGADAD